jgi:hypothetical protein
MSITNTKIWFLPLSVVALFCAGCSPYAFKDLGDGRGVRGAMGYPIGEATAAIAAAQASRPIYVQPSYPQYVPMYQTPQLQGAVIPQQTYVQPAVIPQTRIPTIPTGY